MAFKKQMVLAKISQTTTYSASEGTVTTPSHEEFREQEKNLREKCEDLKKLLRSGYSAKVATRYVHGNNGEYCRTELRLWVFSQRGENEPDDVTHWD